MTIDLLLFGDETSARSWPHGRILRGSTTPAALHTQLANWLQDTNAEALLCWDVRLGAPKPEMLTGLLAGRGDVWHAGLLLGAAGKPGLIDYVMPSWMFNTNPSPEREITSWRLTLAACLIRTSVLRQLGLPCSDFDTILGAGLEWGHRAIRRGAFLRHVPGLVNDEGERDWATSTRPTLDDELRFIVYRFGRFWARWVLGRAIMTGYAAAPALLRAWMQIPHTRPYEEPSPYQAERTLGAPDLANARVTVLIPTLDRYPYLHVVLENLRTQTVRPHEIIIIDQTLQEKRDLSIGEVFSDLPLRLMYQDQPGQCASRNAGLQVATGDYVLFIDDDDELEPTLIEEHLRNLARFDADVSSGVAQEVGTDKLAPADAFVRASDVFPTNNTLVRIDVLRRSGLFDMAFNRAPRADGELGIRVYLSGAFMVLDQRISVLHHHAPAGGLRVHRARVITYRSSRENLTQRHIPHISEIYLVSRHFSAKQRREMLWLRTFETLTVRGGPARRIAKAIVSGVMMPDTISKTIARGRAADEWLLEFPQIAELR